MAYSVGDRVWYVLRKASGRPCVFMAAEVVRVGGPRVGIVVVEGGPARYVSPSSLTTEIAPADVEVITGPRARGLANYG